MNMRTEPTIKSGWYQEAKYPLHIIFLMNYFPTAVSVAFSLFWLTVDHNIKRIEPFFQMSKPVGK